MGREDSSDPETLEDLFLPDDVELRGPDLESDVGKTIHLEGRYEVDPIPGGKRFQGTWLVLDDGSRYLISYRPVPDHFCFLDKRVRVQGKPYLPGRDVQHMGATHLAVESIDLAAGEVPYAHPPTELPLPPLVQSRHDLSALDGQWARIVGVVSAVRDDPDGPLGLAYIRLADGCELLARNALRSRWESHIGKSVKVTSRIRWLERDGGTVPELVGWCEIAPEGSGGVNPRAEDSR